MTSPVFIQLVDAHYASLYRFALSLARSEADACDLVQQTFYIWATKGAALRDAAKAKTWLFTTLYREFLRSRRRDGRLTALEDLSPTEQEVPDESIDHVRRLEGAQVVEMLQHRRERWGYSYHVIPGDKVRDFAAVVAELAGT